MQDKKLWFKAKDFGWGWVPVSWQGWVSTLVYILILVLDIHRIDADSHSASDALIGFAIPFILTTILFLFLAYGTGEKPEWRWGTKRDKTLGR